MWLSGLNDIEAFRIVPYSKCLELRCLNPGNRCHKRCNSERFCWPGLVPYVGICIVTIRRFHHNFTPAGQGTWGQSQIELATGDIANAAIREIVQLSLSAAPFDLLIEQLLVPADRWFRWVSPLGQIRETRTALSGLFGRFVARAYLAHYCGFAYFEPIHSDVQSLAGWPNFTIKRTQEGDLPDWVIASIAGANAVAIAEAKGSHNIAGAAASLGSAKEQVKRIDVLSGGVTLTVKRYAIATRWAIHNNPALQEPWLVVHDPEDGERGPTEEERRLLVRSIGLGHFAALADGLGLHETAVALRHAKQNEPGRLRLPAHEFGLIDQGIDVSPTTVMGAAVVPSGIVHLPRTGDLEEFRSALQTVYGDRCMLFAVDARALHEIDAAEPVLSHEAPSTGPAEEDVPFWSEFRLDADGSAITPLRSIALRRPPPELTEV